MGPDSAQLVAAILNAAWMVRHHARGARMSSQSPLREQRRLAIQHLGITVRDAFNKSQDFEPLLAAVCDGLRPKDDQPF